MTDETIRTLITSIAAVSTTGITVWFALRSLQRRDRIDTLEAELRRIMSEFSLLYEAEKEYISRLCDLSGKPANQIKIDVRRVAIGNTDNKITLTSESVIKKRKELRIE